VAPNKHSSASEQMYKGHLLENETYIGGKVGARSRLPRYWCIAAAGLTAEQSPCPPSEQLLGCGALCPGSRSA